jgi:hypothetical protein
MKSPEIRVIDASLIVIESSFIQPNLSSVLEPPNIGGTRGPRDTVFVINVVMDSATVIVRNKDY